MDVRTVRYIYELLEKNEAQKRRDAEEASASYARLKKLKERRYSVDCGDDEVMSELASELTEGIAAQLAEKDALLAKCRREWDEAVMMLRDFQRHDWR